MRKLANHAALKEWSTVIEALGRGEQVVLIRKGGIADPSFAVESTEFYLYPTYFHQGESDVRPSVFITHWCEVVRTWEVRHIEVLYRLESQVVMPRATLEARYRFRPGQALQVMALRTHALAAPFEARFQEQYAGCRSWVSLEDEIAVDGSRPVLSASVLDAKIDAIDALLTVAV